MIVRNQVLARLSNGADLEDQSVHAILHAALQLLGRQGYAALFDVSMEKALFVTAVLNCCLNLR